MPQTVESISHIKTAKIPFIVVINKIDLAETDPEKVKIDLLKHEVLVEGKGGHVPVALVSAKTGKGIKELLETILLISADLNLTYNPENPVQAYIIETKKDRRGIVVSTVIKDGKIKTGDVLYAQNKKIKVRSIYNDRGQTISEAVPSTPFELLGFDELPEVGRTIQNQPTSDQKPMVGNKKIKNEFTLESILDTSKKEKRLSIVIKTDSQGSLEAIQESIKNNKDIEVILQAVGEINKSDIFLAKATKSIIIGFNVNPSPEAKDLAKQEKIIIKTYQIIYELLDEITEVASLIKEKEEKEKNLKGEAKILANFTIENEVVFGVKVVKGKINLNDPLVCHRENKLIGKTKLVSLRVRAKTVSEVKKGQEAGMMFYPALDIRIGDVVKSIL